jgi:hypothetical protein
MEHGRNAHNSQSVGDVIETLETDYNWSTFQSESKPEIALPVATLGF